MSKIKKCPTDPSVKIKMMQLSNDLCSARGNGLLASTLKSEHNFREYIKMLKRFSKRYSVMIAASDTPCGMAYTREISRLFMDIGLKEDLFGKFRYGYAAVIDAGELLFEQVSSTVFEPVEYQGALGENTVQLLSVGFNAPQANCASIIINGKNFSPGMRGLNIVVYDKVTQSVLDTVNFDTFAESFACHRPSEIVDGLRRFHKQNPSVSIVCFNAPAFPKDNLSPNEQFIISNAIGRAAILNNLDKPIFAINKFYDKDGIIEVLNAPKSYHDINGVRRFEDWRGKYVNIVGGHRVTVNQPREHLRTIYILGGCNIFGVGASDEHTISSFLQKLVNEKLPLQSIVVQNYGFYLAEMGDAQSGEELAILHSLPIKQGDIILWNFSSIPELPFLNMAEAARRPHSFGEVFSDTMHYTPDGYRLIAEELFDGLLQKNLFQTPHELTTSQQGYGLDKQTMSELDEYKKILTGFYDDMFSVDIGAIVMNCNPFTLGHRYLIESALAQCDYLVVFVVQEDRSIFPFDDRLKLVDEGTADLKNIVVIPSGRFIISSLTFSEYFNKSEIQERTIDSSLDVTIFAREIAPCLRITKRFAGEEPYDNITRQYNETMKTVLPEYGIQFVEIPRKVFESEPISASRVRKLLDNKDFKAIELLVPQSTLKYLVERFG